MSQGKVQTPGRGNDAKAHLAWRERAKQTAKFLQENDLKPILAEIVKLYPFFGQPNGKGYEHNYAGVDLAIRRLSAKHPEKRDELKVLLGFLKKSELTVGDVKAQIVKLNIPADAFSVGPSSTDRYEVRVKQAYFDLLQQLDCDIHNPRAQNGQMIAYLDYGKAKLVEAEAKTPDATDYGASLQDAPQGGESTTDTATVPETPEIAPERVKVTSGQWVIYRKNPKKKYVMTARHKRWLEAIGKDGDRITFHQGNAMLLGTWVWESSAS